MNPTYFSQDVRDFLECLAEHDVECVVVGGEAVIYHGHARLTGDIDIFYRLEASNVEMLFAALLEFWGGDIPDIDAPEQLSERWVIIQFGLPPNRIDLLNDISGVSFEEVWNNKVTETLTLEQGKKIPIHYIGKEELKKNKAAANRPKDSDDLKYL